MSKRAASILSLVLIVCLTTSSVWAGDRVRIDPPSENIEKFFKSLNRDTMYLVEEFYDPMIKFYDPIVTIAGRDQMRRYYEGMYQDVQSVRFEFKGEIVEGDDHVVFWTMELTTKKMNKGKPIYVDGNSHIRFGGSEGKAVYHRDYFDVGAMVYEHVAVVGWLTGIVKNKLKKHAELKVK